MGAQGPAHTTLIRYALENVKRRNVVTEQYVREAIDKVVVELVRKKLSQSETRRMRGKAKLRESEERYRTLAEAAEDAIFIVNKDMRLQYCNSFAARLFNATPEELVGKFLESIFPSDTYAHQSLSLRKVFETGLPFSVVNQYKFPDQEMWLDTKLVPLRSNSGGVDAVMGISRDITEHKEMEKALRETEERFRSLVEHTNDILWELDQEGAYTYVSPNVQDILGYSPEHLIGKTPFDFMPEEEAERVGQTFAQIVQERRLFTSLQHRTLCKGGKEILLECSGVPIGNEDGTIQGYRGIDRDITKRVDV
jgi:PAS domain S-box-containing protein